MKNDPAVLATPDCRRLIEDLKARVTTARISAARHVNRDLIMLYWDIGRANVEKQKTLGWGDSVVEMMAADLRRAFPGARAIFGEQCVAHAAVLLGILERGVSGKGCSRIGIP